VTCQKGCPTIHNSLASNAERTWTWRYRASQRASSANSCLTWNGIRNTSAFVPSTLRLDNNNVELQRKFNTSTLSTSLNKPPVSAEVFEVGVWSYRFWWCAGSHFSHRVEYQFRVAGIDGEDVQVFLW